MHRLIAYLVGLPRRWELAAHGDTGARPRFAASRSWRLPAPAAAGTRPRAPCRRHFRRRTSPRGVQVQNISGAGGTIGLAQFATSKRGRGDSILVSGLIMVGAILTNKSAVTLDDVTPLARLTGEYEMLAVTTESPIKSIG